MVVRRNEYIYFRREKSDSVDKSKMSNRLKLSQSQFAQKAHSARGKRGLVPYDGIALPQAVIRVAELKGRRVGVPNQTQANYQEFADQTESNRTSTRKLESKSPTSNNRRKSRMEEL